MTPYKNYSRNTLGSHCVGPRLSPGSKGRYLLPWLPFTGGSREKSTVLLTIPMRQSFGWPCPFQATRFLGVRGCDHQKKAGLRVSTAELSRLAWGLRSNIHDYSPTLSDFLSAQPSIPGHQETVSLAHPGGSGCIAESLPCHSYPLAQGFLLSQKKAQVSQGPEVLSGDCQLGSPA